MASDSNHYSEARQDQTNTLPTITMPEKRTKPRYVIYLNPTTPIIEISTHMWSASPVYRYNPKPQAQS